MVRPIDSTIVEKSEELDVIRSGALAAAPTAVQPRIASLGVNPVSTLAPVETQDSFFQENFSKISLDMYRMVEEMGLEIAQTTSHQLKLDHQQQEKLSQQKAELVKRELEVVRSKENWDKVSTALEYVGYISMIVTSQNVVGLARTLLQGAAILGLANRFGSDTGLSESLLNHFVQSKQTQAQVQTTLRAVAVATSLAGLFLSWQTIPNALPNLHDLVTKMEGFKKVTDIATGAAQVGQKWADRRRAFVQAELKEKDTILTLESKNFQQRMQESIEGNRTLKETTRSIKGILANAEINPIEE